MATNLCNGASQRRLIQACVTVKRAADEKRHLVSLKGGNLKPTQGPARSAAFEKHRLKAAN